MLVDTANRGGHHSIWSNFQFPRISMKIAGAVDIYDSSVCAKFQVKIPTGRWSQRPLTAEMSFHTSD
jgi:hypothetical protein